jgi:hypothetical protein
VPAAGEGTDGTGGGSREGSPPAAGGGGDALGRSDSSRSTMGRMSSGRGGRSHGLSLLEMLSNILALLLVVHLHDTQYSLYFPRCMSVPEGLSEDQCQP